MDGCYILKFCNSLCDSLCPHFVTRFARSSLPSPLTAMDFSNQPVQINVGEVNMLVANKDIKQNIMMVQEGEKPEELAKILGEIVKESPSKEVRLREN